MVHIYCGNGKGKTTAAVGLAVRYAGAGGKVIFYQFMKNGRSSEIQILENIKNINVIHGYDTEKFFYQMNDEEKSNAETGYKKDLKAISDMVFLENDFGMIILDEIISCVSCGFLTVDEVLEFMDACPENTEIIMTGREPHKKLKENADYISEINCVKHPYNDGVHARKGIEY